MGKGQGGWGRGLHCLPPTVLLMKEFAAKALAAHSGYASTRKVKMPVKTRRVLHESQPVSYFSKVLSVSVPHEMRVM